MAFDGAMTNVPRTVTLPEINRPPALDVPDFITAIREYGRAVEHPLLPGQETFTIGSSPSCDLPVASEYVSSLHAVLERRGQRLRVHDQTSRNGTFFRGRREASFDIGPGDAFILATTPFLAVNDHMRLARPIFAEVLGYASEAVVDDVLSIAIQDDPLLIVGERGAGQRALLQTLHGTSLRRGQALVEVPAPPTTREDQKQLIAHARRGTLAVAVNGAPVDDVFLDMALSADFGLRLVLLAPSLESAVQSVKLDVIARMNKIEIRPLRERRGEIGLLLDHLLLENRLSLRATDLTNENLRALYAYDWPENLDELRETVAWIAAIVREGSVRKAAAVLDVPRSTLQYWMERLCLTLPLASSGL